MTTLISPFIEHERAPLLRRRHQPSSSIDALRSTPERCRDVYIGSKATRSSCWPWRALIAPFLAPCASKGLVFAQALLSEALGESSLPVQYRNSLPSWRHFIEHCRSEGIPLARLMTEFSPPQGRCALHHLFEVEDYDAVLLVRPHIPNGLYANDTVASVEGAIGQVHHGVWHGKMVEVYPNGDWYRGEMINGMSSKGWGRARLQGYIWEGQMLNGVSCGYGTMHCPNGQVDNGFFEIKRGPDGRSIRLLLARPNETMPSV